jgi:hypothetical protein
MRINNPIIGLLLGLVGPLIGALIMKYLWFRSDELADYVTRLSIGKDITFKVLSLSQLVNLAPFIYFNSKRWDNAARGVFIATMLWVVFIVLVRYVW